MFPEPRQDFFQGMTEIHQALEAHAGSHPLEGVGMAKQLANPVRIGTPGLQRFQILPSLPEEIGSFGDE